MSHHHRRAAAISAPDPFFQNTVLLLTGNGTNGGQNNTFLDESSNNFTITRYGNTTQGSFSPFGWQWSNYFDGSGDDLRLSSSSAFSLGTGDFTFEAWINPANWTNTAIPFFVVTATGGLWIGKNGSNFVVRAFGVADQLTYSTMPTVGTWTHIVAVRSGTTLSLYYNGSRVATTTNSYSFAQGGLAIGSDADSYSTAYYTGHLSNVRLVKGTAVYDPTQTTLTVPTAPFTAITNTQLLTCQSNRFVDNSSNAFAITRNGDVTVSNFAPFPAGEYAASVEGGSGYFDGTGDYLSVPSNANLNPSNGAFTWECWFYPVGSWDQTSTSGDTLWITEVNSGLQIGRTTTLIGNSWGLASNSVAWRLTTTSLPTIGAWNHLAIVRSGTGTNQTAILLNGNRVAQGTVSATFAQGASYIMDGLSTGATECSGYLSGLRFVKGSAVYDPASSTYTVPTAPLTAITNTQLLLNFTNGSIVDATGKNILETVGNAQISTTVKKYGTGSLAFDGTGDRLVIPYKSDLLLGSGNFTVEMWLYKNANTAYMTACGNLSTANSSAWQVLGDSTGNKIAWYSSNAFQLTSTSSLATSTWHHVAFVRNGTFFKIYLNGTEEASATNSVNFNVTNNLWIGHTPENISGRDWNGYIDDLRITKGIARYTANFTPPYRQLPTR